NPAPASPISTQALHRDAAGDRRRMTRMEIEFLPSDAAATGHWVVVADGERARVFESHRHAPGLRPVLPYDLMVNQLRDGERWSDRAGNVKERANNVMHSMAAPTDPKEHESDLLAK